jgi:hypothetical protein
MPATKQGSGSSINRRPIVKLHCLLRCAAGMVAAALAGPGAAAEGPAAHDDDFHALYSDSPAGQPALGQTLSLHARGDAAALARMAPRIIQHVCGNSGVITWYQGGGASTRITCRLAPPVGHADRPRGYTHLDFSFDTRGGAPLTGMAPVATQEAATARIDIGPQNTCSQGSFVSVAGKAVLHRTGCSNELQRLRPLADRDVRDAAPVPASERQAGPARLTPPVNALSTVHTGPLNPQWTRLSRTPPPPATPVGDAPASPAWRQVAVDTPPAR